MPTNDDKHGSEVERDKARNDPAPKQHGAQWDESETGEHRPPASDTKAATPDTKPTVS